MHVFWIIAAFVLLLVKKHDSEAIRFTLKPYLKFLGWVGLVTVFRFFILKMSGVSPDDVYFPFEIEKIPPLKFFMVWWEDVMFVLPFVLLSRNNVSKKIQIPLMALASALFAAGHLYQGGLWALITLLYVPIMTHFAKKHGLRTTAACHVTYDVLTYLTIAVWVYTS